MPYRSQFGQDGEHGSHRKRLDEPGDVIRVSGSSRLPVGEARCVALVVLVVFRVDMGDRVEVVAEVLDQVLDQVADAPLGVG
jgi:hypothetical protein